MTRLTYLAIRCFVYERMLTGRDVDLPTFRSAVALFRRWSPGASEDEARSFVSGVLLDIIHDDPKSFWRDVGTVPTADPIAA